jgi:multidrug efflux pump
VADLADTILVQKISQLPEVGLVSISGGHRPAVRIHVNPNALAAYNLTMEELRSAITASNVNQAKGNFDGPSQAFNIGANDQLFSGAEFAKSSSLTATAPPSGFPTSPKPSTMSKMSTRPHG